MATYIVRRKKSVGGAGLFLVGCAVIIVGNMQNLNGLTYGGYGVCGLALVVITIFIVSAYCRNSKQRNPQISQVTIERTTTQNVEVPNQNPGVPQGQYPGAQYPGNTVNQDPGQQCPASPDQYPASPDQYPVPPSQYPVPPSQYPAPSGLNPGMVPNPYPVVVSSQYLGVPSQSYIVLQPLGVLSGSGQGNTSALEDPAHVQPPSYNESDRDSASAVQHPDSLARVPPPSYNETINSDKK